MYTRQKSRRYHVNAFRIMRAADEQHIYLRNFRSDMLLEQPVAGVNALCLLRQYDTSSRCHLRCQVHITNPCIEVIVPVALLRILSPRSREDDWY